MSTLEIYYSENHWNLLQTLRNEAIDMMRPLTERHIEALAYGSIARGDVKSTSDIDLFIPQSSAPAILEALIENYATIIHREIVQATPNYVAKGYIYTKEKRSYSFPLVSLRSHERDFYQFAGSVNEQQLQLQERVPGVDKRLILIQPTPKGHNEIPVKGRESSIAKTLNIGVTTVLDRVRTLSRREEIGRTGVYLKHILDPHESFGETYHRLAEKRPSIRRRLREKK